MSLLHAITLQKKTTKKNTESIASNYTQKQQTKKTYINKEQT